jgi:hypothetical protein
MQLFDALGSRIEEAWHRLDYDEARFPAVAAAALREAPPSASIDHREVLRWTLERAVLPPQDDLDATFGDPPITVHQGRRFFIQVILWMEGSTSIHRHGFSGAFHVLDGQSLHARYTFEEHRRVSSRMRLGALRLEGAEILARGATVEITQDLAHALFHLDTPSATVVVRTYHEEEAGPQYDYRPPGLALDPFHKDPTLIRKLQALRFARRAEDPAWAELAAGLVARSDLQTCFAVLSLAQLGPGEPARMGPLLDAARRRHGDVVDTLAAALHEELRQRKLQRLRATQKDAALRFFLALLQNLPDRASILAQVERRYPASEARAQVAAWALALSGIDAIGVDLRDELTRHLFGALLDGASLEQTLERLERVFGPAQVRAQADAIARQRARIRRTALEPLFR